MGGFAAVIKLKICHVVLNFRLGVVVQPNLPDRRGRGAKGAAATVTMQDKLRSLSHVKVRLIGLPPRGGKGLPDFAQQVWLVRSTL